MIDIDLQREVSKDLKKRLKRFQARLPQASAEAANRAAITLRKNMNMEIRKEYTIKATDIKETVSLDKATKATMFAEVGSCGNPISLDRFKLLPRKVSPKRKAPIKAAVKKGATKAIPGAFVTNLKDRRLGNIVGAAMRQSKSRNPIRRLSGPSIPQMLNNDRVNKVIRETGQEAFQKRFDHNVSRILDQVMSQ